MPTKGTWVEIERILLAPEERMPGIPPDTAATPLVARVNGFLQHDAQVGAAVTVVTLAGRKMSGILVDDRPAHSHSFGEQLPELLRISPMLRGMLAGREDKQ